MESAPDSPIGYASNAGVSRYLIEAKSTTGFVAFKIANGTTLVSNAVQVSIAASRSISFWPWAGYEDTTPAGHIIQLRLPRKRPDPLGGPSTDRPRILGLQL